MLIYTIESPDPPCEAGLAEREPRRLRWDAETLERKLLPKLSPIPPPQTIALTKNNLPAGDNSSPRPSNTAIISKSWLARQCRICAFPGLSALLGKPAVAPID